MKHPAKAKNIINLTKAPYHADPTGKKDSAPALCQALNDLLQEEAEGMRESRERWEKDNKSAINPENRGHRIWFPDLRPSGKILFLPAGTYRLSGPVTYDVPGMQNPLGDEIARSIHIEGESRESTILRLDENCPGFEEGSAMAVLDIMQGTKSAVCMNNSIEDLSIEVGAGNPGAIGINFFCNNSGVIRNVAVRSLDPDHRGEAGISIEEWNSSCALFTNIQVDGFNEGLRVLHDRLYTVMEHIEVKNQRHCGVYNYQHVLSLRGLKSENSVPAVKSAGSGSYLCLLEADCRGGAADVPAVDFCEGFLFARDIQCQGYSAALLDRQTNKKFAKVKEYVSHPPRRIFGPQAKRSLAIKIEEPPTMFHSTKESDWVFVGDLGAVGDGKHDDSEAIQKAMDSGKACVGFHGGRFLLSQQIVIPEHVRTVHFYHADFESTPSLSELQGAGVFKVLGDGADALTLTSAFTFGQFKGDFFFIEHAGKRPLFVRDVHTQLARIYQNSVSGGKVWFENVACTNGRIFGTEENLRPCVSLNGQQAWARQLNPERAHPEVVNDGGSFWLLGFKTEGEYTSFWTKNSGESEILGGILNFFRNDQKLSERAAIVNENSSVSATCVSSDPRVTFTFRTIGQAMVRESQGIQEKEIEAIAFPRRADHLPVIPLYVGRKREMKTKAE